ncbi:MAG: hypothetical protein CMM84_16180 [Rhodothermaceae bacterium]|nr:hypothetical protein [Rhodothermaceae bacterium]MBC12517.1 hypothetical protein [Rhodothermaceae bacterium]
MTDTDTSALEAIADASGDFIAAAISQVRDGFQWADAFALIGDVKTLATTVLGSVDEARAEIADLDFDDGVALAGALVRQAPKIRGALTGADLGTVAG